MKTTSTHLSPIHCLLFSTTVLLLWNCASPKSALEKGHYANAMHLATKSIERGKDVDENTLYLQTAAKAVAEQTLQEYYDKSGSKFTDWKKSQGEFYRVLHQLGKSNIETEGLVSESYDMVCEVKQEIDLKIINYFYDEGIRLLDASIYNSKKILARDAYDQFILAEKEEAAVFYDNLEELKAECILYGSITVDANSDIAYNDIFLKPYDSSSDDVPDCSVGYNADFANFTSSSTLNTTEQRNNIIIGQNSFVDTSGIVRFENLTQEVVGFRNETTFNYLLTQNLNINVIANTSECFLSSRSVVLSEPETCVDVRYTGDRRAFTVALENFCNELIIKGTLEQRLLIARRNNLFVN